MKHSVAFRLAALFLTLCLLFTGNVLTVSAIADEISSSLAPTPS